MYGVSECVCVCFIWGGPTPFSFIEVRNVEVFPNLSFSGNEKSPCFLPQECQQPLTGSRRTHSGTKSLTLE